jgi:hypothetical protein
MYACLYEIRGGFFSGVCTLSNATANFRDPPPPPNANEPDPVARTPARSGSHAVLSSATL